MPFLTACNNGLDKLVRPEIRALHKSWQAYQVCGYTGFGLAIVLTMGGACLVAVRAERRIRREASPQAA